MKPFIVALVILCVAIAGGTIVYLNRPKAPPIPGPIAEPSSRQTKQTHVEKIVVPKQENPRTVSDRASGPTPIPVTNSVSRDSKPDSAVTALSQTTETLVSAQTSFSDKQALLRQLKKAGGLDQVIAELKERAAGNPNDPWIPTALGEAYLNKFPVQDYNEAAILGLQADQSFDAAIKLDPSNWEAQYFKAASLSHWPAEMNKGPEVIQRFSALIDQQETMPPQPQFAQTYVLLGEQYQKAGQPDYAQQTWRPGQISGRPNAPKENSKAVIFRSPPLLVFPRLFAPAKRAFPAPPLLLIKRRAFPQMNSSKPDSLPSAGSRSTVVNSLICASLMLVTFAVYAPSLHHPFLCLDDQDYVVKNPHVHGLSWENVVWAFTHFHSSNWHPLTWISHMLDCSLWGLNPAGHHLVNVLFHAANAALLFLLFVTMTGARWRSAWVAALFAWHPLHVESVAWVAERKDVLSTFFGFLSLIFYARYARRQEARSKQQGASFSLILPPYFLSLIFFACGLMAKPMLVTLPFVMLLLDFWPLGRISNFKFRISNSRFDVAPQAKKDSRPSTLDLRLIVWEKAPFFLLAAASCAVTFITQKNSGAVSSLDQVAFPLRLANALVSYIEYIVKTLWPANLAVLYPFHAPALWLIIVAAILLATATALIIVASRRAPYLPVGWFWFLGGLVPVIGLVQVGAQAMADRYTYLPVTGLFIIAAWGIPQALQHWRHWRPVVILGAAISLALCLMGTTKQLRYWRDSQTLFARALAVTSDNAFARRLLADSYQDAGEFDGAITNYIESLRLNPADAEARNNLGVVLRQVGRVDEAMLQIQEALKVKPEFPNAHDNLATTLLQRGDFTDAIAHFQEALRLDPNAAQTYNNLAWLRATCTDPKFRDGVEAVRLALRAIELDGTEDPTTLDTLAAAQAEAGQFDEAVNTAQRAGQLALSAKQIPLADAIAGRLELYRQHLPYRAGK